MTYKSSCDIYVARIKKLETEIESSKFTCYFSVTIAILLGVFLGVNL